MIIPKSVEYEVESHFVCYAEEKQRIKELATDIAEAITPNLDGVGGSGSISDPTAQKAAQIEKETSELKSWVEVVEATIAHFNQVAPDKVKLIKLYYFELYEWRKVQMALHIGSSTFFKWREDVIVYAAAKAMRKKLVDF